MDAAQTTTGTDALDPLQNLTDHPWLAAFASVLLMAGLAADLWIVISSFRKRAAPEEGEVKARLPIKPWGLAEVGLITGALCCLMFIGSMVLHWLEKAGVIPEDESYAWQMLGSGILLDGVGILTIWLLLRTARVSVREAFGIGNGSALVSIGRGIFLLLAALPPVWVVAGVSQQICQQIDLPVTRQETLDLFLSSESFGVRMAIACLAIIAAPIFEELFFRGLVYPALKQKVGGTLAMLLTALIFAAIHLHAPSFLPLTVLAVALTLAYEATGNLLVPIVMHSLFNLMSLVVMIILRP